MLEPMIAMAALTFGVGMFTISARFRAVSGGAVSMRYFSLMQGDEVPDRVVQTTRCFNNMFEVPVLFYVAGVILHFSGPVPDLAVKLAWAFVFFRLVQATIHLTYNHVMHRMVTFFLAYFSAVGLWIVIALTHL